MPTIQDFLVEQAPQIGVDINQKMMAQTTPWITLYKQEAWDDERSSVQKTFQFDRALIVDSSGVATDEVDWAKIATGPLNANSHQSNAYSADGIPPADNIAFTQTLRDFNLEHKAIWGPQMNVNQLRDKFVRNQQMAACVKALADQSREFWIQRKRSEYARVADNMVVLDSSFDLPGGDFNNLAVRNTTGSSESILTNGFTNIIYEYLNHQGAAEGSLGMSDGRPVYGLVTSARQSRRLIMADTASREDFRFSSQNEKLLAAMGAKYTYNGFTHLIDDKVDRWEYATLASAGVSNNVLTVGTATKVVGGGPTATTLTLTKGSTVIIGSTKWVVTGKVGSNYSVKDATGGSNVSVTSTAGTAWIKVPQYIASNGKRVPNPAWLSATWEDSYIFHQGTCTSLVPKPITAVGSAKFNPVNYAGEFTWTNYAHRTENPDGQIGQFRGVLANGTRPDNPEFGILVRHLAAPRPSGIFVSAGAGLSL